MSEINETNKTIGFIGLGKLGLPIATNLIEAGYTLKVYNRTQSKAAPLAAKGAEVVNSPAEAVPAGGIVITLLWDDASVEDTIRSEGFLAQLGQGGIHISMTTILPETSKKLAAIHTEHGSVLVEAPIFGRPEAATAKQLWIPFAGPQSAKERVQLLLKDMGAQGIFDLGEVHGAANMVKLVGNFLIISAGRSIQEALTMAQQNGVDPKPVIDMLTQTLFTAPIYQSYGKRIAEGTASFPQSAIPVKDLGLFKATAEQVGSPTPIASLLRDLMQGGTNA